MGANEEEEGSFGSNEGLRENARKLEGKELFGARVRKFSKFAIYTFAR